jgi:hypothetical protein
MSIIGFVLSLVLVFSLDSIKALAGPSFEDKSKCLDNNGTDLFYKKNNKFKVLAYSSETDSFQIISTEFYAEGNSEVTLGGLALAVSSIKADLEKIRVEPKSIVSGFFIPEKDLPTLLPKEIKQRKACLKSN